jgi:hypothetical protein
MCRSRACEGMDCLLGKMTKGKMTKGTTCTNTRQAILSTITAAPLRAGFRAALTAFIVKSPLCSILM